MAYYAYRYQIYTDKVPTTHVTLTSNPRLSEIISLEGSCTAYARGLKNGTTRVKPCNLLCIPSKYIPQIKVFSLAHYFKSTDQLRDALASIPWTVNFSTIDLDDYPEFFI